MVIVIAPAYFRFLSWITKSKITGQAILGVILVSSFEKLTLKLINHERIHNKQALEMLFVGFYVAYALFYLRLRIKNDHKYAYMNNPFEKEAYANEADLKYLKNRKFYSWIRYI